VEVDPRFRYRDRDCRGGAYSICPGGGLSFDVSGGCPRLNERRWGQRQNGYVDPGETIQENRFVLDQRRRGHGQATSRRCCQPGHPGSRWGKSVVRPMPLSHRPRGGLNAGCPLLRYGHGKSVDWGNDAFCVSQNTPDGPNGPGVFRRHTFNDACPAKVYVVQPTATEHIRECGMCRKAIPDNVNPRTRRKRGLPRERRSYDDGGKFCPSMRIQQYLMK